MTNFKKTAAVLMLVSYILSAASPAAAVNVAGIQKGVKFTEVGDTRSFGDRNWTLYDKDDNSGYMIMEDTGITLVEFIYNSGHPLYNRDYSFLQR